MSKLSKIKINDILHYIFIYLMYIIPASTLYTDIISKTNFIYVILILLLIPLLINKKYRSIYVLSFVGFIVFITFFTRFLNGGAGIRSMTELLNCVLVINLAYNFNREKFISRFCKFTIIMAVISLIGFAFSFIPSIYNKLPLYEYFDISHGTGNYAVDYYGKGLLVYSFLEIHPNRNCGIFTEPGKYQIVLNSVLFILLFFENIYVSVKERTKYIFIIIITILTTTSTTAYIGTAFILIIYFLFGKLQIKNFKKKIAILFGSVAFVLCVDLVFNYDNSFIATTILSKLFSNGELDLGVDTGLYRLTTIEYSFKAIFINPFGLGFDKFNELIPSNYGYSGAAYFKFMAIYGIIPWIVYNCFSFAPLIKKKFSPHIILCFIILFVNTTLAQTHAIYPSLIMFPFIVYLGGFENEKKSYNCA